MRTGAIFARGSCRALKWMALFGVVFALGAGSAAAQSTVTINSLTLNAASVDEGGQATATVRFTIAGDADGVAAGTTTVGFAYDLDGLTTDVAATNASATSFYGLTDATTASQQTVRLGALVANGRQAYTVNHTFGLNHDLDAEDGKFRIEVNIGAIDGGSATEMVSTSTYLIDDDEDQLYQLSIPAANRGAITEGGTAAVVTLTANPKRTATTTVPTFTVVTDPADTTLYTYAPEPSPDIATNLSAATVNDGAPAMVAIGNISAQIDKNRVADMVTLKLYSGLVGASVVQHELPITVTDAQPLAPAANITAVAKDKDGDDVTSVAEGGDPVYLTISVDRGRLGTATTTETLTIDIEPANPADAIQYAVEPDRVSLLAVAAAAGKQSTTTEIKLSARSDDDIGPMDLDLNLVVSGSPSIGTETSTGTFSIAITDTTDALVSVKEEDDEAYDAIKAVLGEPPTLSKGMSGQIMTAALFDWDPMAVRVSFGTSVEGAAVSASASGEMVTIMADAEGEAKVTVTATATPMSSSLTVDQTVSNIAQFTFPVSVALSELSVDVTAVPMEIMEGGMSTITAMASREVAMSDGEVKVDLEVVGDGELSASSITIAAGDMMGTATVTAMEDDDDYADESLTVIARGAGEATIEIMVTDNDEAPVPPEPTNVITAKSSDDIYPLIMAAGLAGDDAMFNPGMSAELDASMMFDVMEGYSASYGAESDAMNVASTSVSGSMVTVTAAEAGMAHVVITATATMASGVMPGQPATNVATVMFPVNVVNMPLSVTVSTDPMDMVEEGGTITVTAMANRMVLADDGDVEVMLTITGAVEMNEMMISIAAGMDSGTAMIQVLDDMEVAPMADITIVATGSGIATAETSTIAVTENDSPRTFTLSAPDDMMQLVEGGDGVELTVTADPAVSVDTEVTIMVDRAASTADADDFTAAAITIMAGEASGTTMLMATDDGPGDSGHGSPEMLVVLAMADNTQSNTVSFYIWDMAVPALPLIAQLLLAAFLAIGGYRRYRRP